MPVLPSIDMDDFRHLLQAGVTLLLFLGLVGVAALVIRLGMNHLSKANLGIASVNDKAAAAKHGEYDDTKVSGSEVALALSQNTDGKVAYYYTTTAVINSIAAGDVPLSYAGEPQTAFQFFCGITSYQDLNGVGLPFANYFKGEYNPWLTEDDIFYLNPDAVFYAHQINGTDKRDGIIFVQMKEE